MRIAKDPGFHMEVDIYRLLLYQSLAVSAILTAKLRKHLKPDTVSATRAPPPASARTDMLMRIFQSGDMYRRLTQYHIPSSYSPVPHMLQNGGARLQLRQHAQAVCQALRRHAVHL